ncbi:phosphopantetheine adenylyltransferase [Mycoplasmopsis maculosa]|uniref:Phosphopantetheine adenylyltransferase n=1 Tax=Mycoplasmopsis maculosa TaxID=114885 RepID=A0A449B4H3_9BACT|nr:pantetheine-phosphate adenylyltransferase [Mycoplasmopsis maculosa]VEU75465.1 phosphopantetheine adenylyltransferase [Mycoplasmopsis maculosa]
MKSAIYPGSFDPLHKGHIAIIEKALKLFDKIYVIVSVNPDKDNIDNIHYRFLNVKNELKNFSNVEVILNKDDFIANIAKKLETNFIIRSARNNVDYQYELILAAGNNSINNNLETILILPDYQDIEYSSTLIRHKSKLGK